MSLLKIPFSLSIIWAVHTITTAPQPPPRPSERVGPIGLEVYLLPPAIKTCFYLTGLAEISAILANRYPGNALSTLALSTLIHSSHADRIQFTWPFLLAWICCISGAWIRQRCYQLLGELFTFEISLRQNHTLITSGPYAFVRHPSYSSAALGLFGALACHTISGSWLYECAGVLQSTWAGPLIGLAWVLPAVIFVIAIVPRLEKEDHIMKGRFGSQWDRWAANVPYRLVPWAMMPCFFVLFLDNPRELAVRILQQHTSSYLGGKTLYIWGLIGIRVEMHETIFQHILKRFRQDRQLATSRVVTSSASTSVSRSSARRASYPVLRNSCMPVIQYPEYLKDNHRPGTVP